MQNLKRSIVLLSAALLVALAAPRARASEWNGRTYITFSEPVTLPGVTLPAGTYLFEHLEPGLTPHRHVVQVFNQSGTELYATLLAVPDYRLRAHGEPVIVFRRTPARQPEAIRAWFYPGEHAGDEFVYPKAEAMKLAMASHTSVLTSSIVPAEARPTMHARDDREVAQLRHAKVIATNGRGEMEALDATSATELPPAQRVTLSPAPARMASLSMGGSTADDDTYLTFSGPVALPGVVLPAGTYLFRHLPPGLTTHRHVVQVLAPNGSAIYATLLTIPDQRLTPSGKPVVVFRETPAGQPEAIKAWFYPGDRTGDEFVYPRHEAMQLAMANHENVLSSPAVPVQASTAQAEQEIKALRHASVAALNGRGRQEAANTTSPAEIASQQPVTMSRKPVQLARATPARSLPETASLLPLFGFLALAAPLGAAGVRAARRRLS
ncbi:MAG: hypothetical protein KGN76_07420, partial [Acidobacteriota bacterium]|nr:hypothetical protein [Acidobacteriota bacterium]